MNSRKLSVSLNEFDIAFIDEFIKTQDLPSRSAGIQHAIKRLRESELSREYAEAWEEDAESAELWDSTSGDGL